MRRRGIRVPDLVKIVDVQRCRKHHGWIAFHSDYGQRAGLKSYDDGLENSNGIDVIWQSWDMHGKLLSCNNYPINNNYFSRILITCSPKGRTIWGHDCKFIQCEYATYGSFKQSSLHEQRVRTSTMQNTPRLTIWTPIRLFAIPCKLLELAFYNRIRYGKLHVTFAPKWRPAGCSPASSLSLAKRSPHPQFKSYTPSLPLWRMTSHRLAAIVCSSALLFRWSRCVTNWRFNK